MSIGMILRWTFNSLYGIDCDAAFLSWKNSFTFAIGQIVALVKYRLTNLINVQDQFEKIESFVYFNYAVENQYLLNTSYLFYELFIQ